VDAEPTAAAAAAESNEKNKDRIVCVINRPGSYVYVNSDAV